MDSSDVLFVRTDALEAKEAMSCYEAACVKNNKDQIPAGHQVATCQLQNSDSGTAIQETASIFLAHMILTYWSSLATTNQKVWS